MQLGKVIGSVVCTQKVPSWRGQRLRLVQPISQTGRPHGAMIVALDVVSSGSGQQVFFVKGREAAHALENVFNPADATIVALVDRLESSGTPPEEAGSS